MTSVRANAPRPDQKLVLMSDELFGLLAQPGERITVDWGKPDADGIYTPTVYRTLKPSRWTRLRIALGPGRD